MRAAKVCEVPGREMEVTLTVQGPICGGSLAGRPTTETFPATVRTRLIYEGRPAFLANDPIPSYFARCVLCRDLVGEGGTDDEAAASLDMHLRVTHGIEVES